MLTYEWLEATNNSSSHLPTFFYHLASLTTRLSGGAGITAGTTPARTYVRAGV